jgi:Nif-specific regulatory protein
VGDLALDSQRRLVQLLAQEAFQRDSLRSSERFRLIASTAGDCEEATRKGRFRLDLYHRLTVLTIVVPPLRSRRDDVPLLVDHFLRKFAAVRSKAVRRVSARASDLLARYDWPGNVRELSNAVERAVVLCEGDTLHAHHLPRVVQQVDGRVGAPFSLQETVEAYEREILEDALRSARGIRSRAARLLKTTDRILNYKIRTYGIEPRRFKL